VISNEASAPYGCRDPRSWTAAAELLALHDVKGCSSCVRGMACSVVISAMEAQDRAMRPTAGPPVAPRQGRRRAAH
jgi:hypothetical protein